MIRKSRQETIGKLIIELAKIETLYKANCVNWKGTTKDSKEHYTEVVAEELLRHLKEFDKIIRIKRINSYYSDTHSYIKSKVSINNRAEENFAKRITGLEFENIGLITDFQIPLKDSLGNKGIGKIDLISYKKAIKTLFLIELKYNNNEETLLRALLESYTYFKIVEKPKLINDFINNQTSVLNKVFNSENPNEIIIKPAVLLVPGCRAFNELNLMELGRRPMLKKLFHALEVNYFTLENFSK